MTQYERGVRVERIIEHRLEYDGNKVIRSAGSHKEADLVNISRTGVALINVKIHEGLRDKVVEEELRRLPRPDICYIYTGFLRKKGSKTYIVLKELKHGIEWILEPLTKEQEKKYQEMKKTKYAARKSAKSKSDVRLLSGV